MPRGTKLRDLDVSYSTTPSGSPGSASRKHSRTWRPGRRGGPCVTPPGQCRVMMRTSELAEASRAAVTALANGKGTMQSYAHLACAHKVTPRIAKRKGYAPCLSSRDQTWKTPAPWLASIVAAGCRDRFDLGPCAPRDGGPVSAATHRTEADEGLSRLWSGLVFVDPPYSRSLPAWVSKCATEASAGAVVIGLVLSRTDTRWWHSYVVGQADVIMLKGRLRFGDGAGSAPFPSAVAVWGDSVLAERISADRLGSWLIRAQSTPVKTVA